MVRYLALLIVCVVAVLAQAGPSMAHVGEFTPSVSEKDQAASLLKIAPADNEDCASGSGCCSAICAPCFLSLAAQSYGFASFLPTASQTLVLRQDCLRSIILGRDPPIPRDQLI